MRRLRLPTAVGSVTRICAIAIASVAIVAGIVSACIAPAARASLGWTFPGAPPTLETAAEILSANATQLGGLCAAALVVQAPWIAAGTDLRPGRSWLLTRLLCDVVCGYMALKNVLVVGVGVGAYGGRMLLALLPHGPVELLAFAQAGALYVRARRAPLAPRAALLTVAGAALTLILAAALETFVSV